MRSQWQGQMHRLRQRAGRKKYTRENAQRAAAAAAQSPAKTKQNQESTHVPKERETTDELTEAEAATRSDEVDEYAEEQREYERTYHRHDPSMCSSTDSHERLRQQLDGLKSRGAEKVCG